MQTLIHKADSRGEANFGWLQARHTFSFSNYYNPQRICFGVLRVLNDDIIAPAGGFDTHPHENMEIITIPLRGSLAHKDTMGNGTVIQRGEVQTMSAGTGLMHSEFNASQKDDVNLLQIWVLPNQKDVSPRYDQKSFDLNERKNKWQLIVSPDGRENSTQIQQDAFFYLADLEKDQSINYKLNDSQNGVYLFVIEGALQVGDTLLNKRDGMGAIDFDELKIKALTHAEILIMEVPDK